MNLNDVKKIMGVMPSDVTAPQLYALIMTICESYDLTLDAIIDLAINMLEPAIMAKKGGYESVTAFHAADFGKRHGKKKSDMPEADKEKLANEVNVMLAKIMAQSKP